MKLLSSLKGLTGNSTEAKIKHATNDEPLGPYNHELMEISLLTFNYKKLATIVKVLVLRLNTINSSHEKSSVRRALSQSSIEKKSAPFATPIVKSKTAHYNELNSNHLGILKSLTVILYLLQNGLERFLEWICSDYKAVIQPLLGISKYSQYHDSILFKANRVISLCSDREELNEYRRNIHRMRTDMITPGVKRSSTEMSNVHLSTSEYIISSPVNKKSKGFQGSSPRGLSTLLEEKRSSVSLIDSNISDTLVMTSDSR